MTKKKHYFGNYPGSSSGYDPNVPYGFNKWDAEDEIDTEDDKQEENINDEENEE